MGCGISKSCLIKFYIGSDKNHSNLVIQSTPNRCLLLVRLHHLSNDECHEMKRCRLHHVGLPVSIGSSLLCHLWFPILKSFFFEIKKPLHLLNQLINNFLFLILTQITELELVHALKGSLYLTFQINSFQIISKYKISHFILVIDKQI